MDIESTKINCNKKVYGRHWSIIGLVTWMYFGLIKLINQKSRRWYFTNRIRFQDSFDISNEIIADGNFFLEIIWYFLIVNLLEILKLHAKEEKYYARFNYNYYYRFERILNFIYAGFYFQSKLYIYIICEPTRNMNFIICRKRVEILLFRFFML